MIEFPDFDFACPPLVGGMGVALAIVDVYAVNRRPISLLPHADVLAPFPRGGRPRRLRVSLVCHPVRWLARCHYALTEGREPYRGPAWPVWLPRASLEEFVVGYLDGGRRGLISGLFRRYEADSVIRVEDLPQALWELMASVGAEEKVPTGTPIPVEGMLPDGLRRWVVQSEPELCERYDYY